ncbi:hypothetical protein [Crocosphaera sp. Alani8]|uniref:hypothetical protein n=1 Tax=Crocosphaera sp. Alani8 TaxID=3038952 RepID=UPI00313DFC33
MNQNLFAEVALAQIPKILTLLDRNVHSPTYGCFDRNFWQYKIIDFPSGMAQEFVYPLALAYHTNLEINPFYQQSSLRDWVAAGIHYANLSSHADGSCDDYFPFERAAGAAAFSLLACLESYQLMGLKNQQFLDFFAKRATWLANHHESGKLTNHQALIVLCLERLSQILNTSEWDKQKALRLERVIDWQNEEGWFQEYEGCDPGYHTLTIYCLSQIYQIRPDTRLKEVLEKAVKLASYFIHPDGSYGGEYASRNTYNFFPAGFEFVGTWLPEALTINDQFLKGISQGLVPCYADDHIVGHHTWNYLLAWQHFTEKRPDSPIPKQGHIHLKNAQLMIDRRENYTLYIALNKGGVFKLFDQDHLIASDTQFSLRVKNGKKAKNAVAHLVDNYSTKIEDNRIIITGELGWAKQKQMTPFNLLILRLVMLTVGRFFPNLIRKILQKILITGKQKAPFWFKRELIWEQGKWQIKDTLNATSWDDVVEIGIGCDQTSIYVVMSRTFQLGQLQPWLDLTEKIKSLSNDQALTLNRTF